MERVANDAKVQMFARKFNGKILAIVDLRTGQQHGAVDIEKGVTFEEWDRSQPTLRNGHRLLTREEALGKEEKIKR